MTIATAQTVFNVFSDRFEQTKGEDAWRSNLRLTAMAADRIRSSLGPNGAYKMVTYNRGPEKIVKVTRDAIAVAEELAIQYPTLVVLSEAAKLQRQEVGDGVKSFIILTAALLKRADLLISRGVHPTRILRGYGEAAKKALQIVNLASKTLGKEELELVLDTIDCGRGSLTPKVRWMLLKAKAIATQEGRLDRDRIRVIRKPGGEQSETQLITGIVIKKGKLHPNMPERLTKPRIALTSQRIGIHRLEVKMPGQGPFHMEYKINTPESMKGYRDAEKHRKVNALNKLSELGVNVLLSQQPIDDFAKSKLVQMGVLAFSSVDQADLTLVSKATGARIIGNLAELESEDVGSASSVELSKILLEDIATFSCENFATLIVRASTVQAADELELLIDNSARFLQVAENSGKKVPGGGATELRIASELRNFALQFSGREQLAVENFAEAIFEIPRSLASNNGLFVEDAISRLTKLHVDGFKDCGFAADGSCQEVCADLAEVKSAFIRRAFEVASLLLRIDEQVIAKEVPKFHKK